MNRFSVARSRIRHRSSILGSWFPVALCSSAKALIFLFIGSRWPRWLIDRGDELLSERATTKPGVSISDDPSSITISELVAVVLVTDADHVAVGVYGTHYSTTGSATRLNSVSQLTKYEADASIPNITLRTHMNANAWRFFLHDTFPRYIIWDQYVPLGIWELENKVCISSEKYFLLSYELTIKCS